MADGSSRRHGCAQRPALAAPPDPGYYANYRYFWWLDPDWPGRFYALGKYGQYVYVAPDADTVVVRFGRSSGVTSTTWLATFRDVADT
jgi:CubicO group peptidase (beta-lactamase class C family)